MPPDLRLRHEPFGAWLRLPDDTLVAVDQTRARALGIPPSPLWSSPDPPPSAPLEVHVAVTSRCPVACTGCYQSASPSGDHVSFEHLTRTLDTLSAQGVFTVAFGGGEPLLRDDLGALARLARDRGLTPVVTTSGIGMTPRRAETLRDFAQVNVSHDGLHGGFEAVRGYDGAAWADRAVTMLREAGVAVGINHVLTRHNVDRLEAFLDHAAALGVREVQLLRYKPAGRAASLEYLARRMTPAQCDAVGRGLSGWATRFEGRLSLRVDCALVPLLSEHLGDAATLARFGVFGCEAGGHLGSVRTDGAMRGCSFVTDDAEDVLSVAVFRAWRAAPAEPCASCRLREVCRGGCKVVTRHLGGGMGADPECPRVRAATSGR